MNINLEGFDDRSRVWIYQSNRQLTDQESIETQRALDDFAGQWVAHNQQLKSKAILVENRFIILAVDESMTNASGCSIDSSVHFLKKLEQSLGVDLFDRMRFAFIKQGQIHSVNRLEFSDMYSLGEITDDTMVVDTLVQHKRDLPYILKPLKESWHYRML